MFLISLVKGNVDKFAFEDARFRVVRRETKQDLQRVLCKFHASTNNDENNSQRINESTR